MICDYIKDERKIINKDILVNKSNLLDVNILHNMDIFSWWDDDMYVYKYMVRRGQFQPHTCLVLNILEYSPTSG
jgi:hypothetical protein